MGSSVTTSSNIPVLAPGSRIKGKWHGRAYRIIRKLGSGESGIVYLAVSEANESLCAVKVGFDLLGLQLEINAMKTIARKGGKQLLHTSDDCRLQGRDYPFYAMRYIEGVPPQVFLAKHGWECFPVIGLQLLRQLLVFHRGGYAFGDLKLENIL